MEALMQGELIAIWGVLRSNMSWMSWNLFLAFVPLALSIWLFRFKRHRSWLWWLGFLVFFAFLPNAPYVLTDVIHLYEDIRQINSVWMVTLVVIPMYLIFIVAGFEAYVVSIINLGYYLHQIGRSQWVLGAELVTHALCAVGVYLGRFQRFNSWDFITQPDTLATTVAEDLLGKRPLVIIAITFVVNALLYWMMKRVTLGLVLPRRRWQAHSVSEMATDRQKSNTDLPKTNL